MGGNGLIDLLVGCLEVFFILSMFFIIFFYFDEFVLLKKNMFVKIVFGFVCRLLFGLEMFKDGFV